MAETLRQGQGKLVRRSAFWLLAFLVIWGARVLYTWLINTFEGTRTLLFGGEYADGWVIPVFEQRFDVAFVVAWAVAGLGLFMVARFLGRDRSVTFLVDTEDELKKVTWPSWPDAKASSMIVLVFVLFLAAILYISDIALEKVFSWVLT